MASGGRGRPVEGSIVSILVGGFGGDGGSHGIVR